MKENQQISHENNYVSYLKTQFEFILLGEIDSLHKYPLISDSAYYLIKSNLTGKTNSIIHQDFECGIYDIIFVVVALTAHAEALKDVSVSNQVYFKVYTLLHASKEIFRLWKQEIYGAFLFPYQMIDDSIHSFIYFLYCVAAKKEVEISPEFAFFEIPAKKLTKEEVISSLDTKDISSNEEVMPLTELGVETKGKVYSFCLASLLDPSMSEYQVLYTKNASIIKTPSGHIDSVLFTETNRKDKKIYETISNISHSKCKYALLVTTPIEEFEFSTELNKSETKPICKKVKKLHLSRGCKLEFANPQVITLQKLAGAPFFLGGSYMIVFEVLKNDEISIELDIC